MVDNQEIILPNILEIVESERTKQLMAYIIWWSFLKDL